MKRKHTILSSALLAIAAGPAFAELHVYSAIPLIGTEEVPDVTTDSYGVFTGIYDDASNMLHYSFAWELETAATAAHFHGPAERGENASVLINLGPVSGTSGEERGSVTLTAAQETQLLDGMWYINVHTAENPGGEVRAQLVELTPAAAVSVYDIDSRTLDMGAVIVPGLGVFNVELGRIEGREPLSIEVNSVEPTDFDGLAEPATP